MKYLSISGGAGSNTSEFLYETSINPKLLFAKNGKAILIVTANRWALEP